MNINLCFLLTSDGWLRKKRLLPQGIHLEETIDISPEYIEIIADEDYTYEVVEHFSDMPEVAKPLLKGAKTTFKKSEEMLYKAPAFINLVKASAPEQAFQTILTDEQKTQIANGI